MNHDTDDDHGNGVNELILAHERERDALRAERDALRAERDAANERASKWAGIAGERGAAAAAVAALNEADALRARLERANEYLRAVDQRVLARAIPADTREAMLASVDRIYREVERWYADSRRTSTVMERITRELDALRSLAIDAALGRTE